MPTCEECQRAADGSSPSRHSNPDQIRLVIIDIRSDMLQRETMLPRTGKLDFKNEIDKKALYQQIKDVLAGLTAQHDQIHICLLGLKSQEVPKSYDEAHEMGFGFSPLGKSQQEGAVDISSFHEKVLRTVIEIFYKEQTKYVSFLPGGFRECHDYVEKLNLVQLQKMCIEDLIEPPFLQFLEPHDGKDCYNCFLMAEESETQAPARKVSASFKGRHTMTRMSDSSPYVVVDRFGEAAGELTTRDTPTDKNYPFLSQNAAGRGEVATSGSKYNISFSLNANLPVKEENKQSSLEQPYDIFTGFRSWWQDNVTNQKLLSGFTAVTDMEITNPPANKRAGSYHRDRAGNHAVLKNVTELTRHNLGKPGQHELLYRQQDALSLVGS